MQDFSPNSDIVSTTTNHTNARKKENFGQDIRKGDPKRPYFANSVKDFWRASIFYPCQCMLQCERAYLTLMLD
jgi:hypothetical protein